MVSVCPVDDSNPLVVEWYSFVTQYRYLGTANESTRIDEELLLSAYTNIHALLQLALDLETTHTLSMCISILTRRDF